MSTVPSCKQSYATVSEYQAKLTLYVANQTAQYKFADQTAQYKLTSAKVLDPNVPLTD